MSYELLIEIGWKSALTSGGTLLILRALERRSAAERSLVATAGVFATLFLPVMAILGPRWRLETPEGLPKFLVQGEPTAASQGTATGATPETPATIMPPLSESSWTWLSSDTAGWLLYLGPAALLLSVTLAGVLRLYFLRARSEILIEQDWLTALARAQRRMRFKHGTALLVSDDLSSPISWGVFRPTIVLNSDALQSTSTAEPIIAHELAHLARLDWAKLILGRAACAIFWFNPLVWLLVRASHQLCEEAADDAVLAAEVPSSEYASLLVEAATHQNRGLLVAANGVAPGPASLKLRVVRILNPRLRRHPARVGWAAACMGTALLAITPLAAIAPVAPGALPDPQQMPMPAAVALAAPSDALSEASDAGEGLVRELVERSSPSLESANLRPIVAPADPQTAAGLGTLAPFGRIEISGGGEVVLRHGSLQSARILSGNGPHARASVEAGILQVSCHSSCTGMVVEVVTREIPMLGITGGGTIRAQSGFPAQRQLDLQVRGGGLIDTRAVSAVHVAAETTGGGRIMTSARAHLAAKTTGGGEITYWGEPEVVTTTQGGRIARGGQT